MTVSGRPFVATLLVAMASVALCVDQPPSHPYYPLSVGNSWQYIVHPEEGGGRDSKLTWQARKADKGNSGRVVYQVWPVPMDADDDAMLLTISDLGLEDASTRLLVLKMVLTSGDQWSSTIRTGRGMAKQSFKVLSVGKPCSADLTRFPDCAVVEQLDPATQMRTLTTYAKGVGPVEFRYFRVRAKAKEKPIQTLTLKSYTLKP